MGEIDKLFTFIERLHNEREAFIETIVGGPAKSIPAPVTRLDSQAAGAAMFLDSHQADAAAHFYGPMRVLAPAGSGKTRTLTARIAGLTRKGVHPDRILALAFNRKAAGEMAERLETMGIAAAWVRTFHSFGYEVIRQAWGWTYSPKNETLVKDLVRSAANRQFKPKIVFSTVEALGPVIKGIQKGKAGLQPFLDMDVSIGYGLIPLEGVFRRVLARQFRLRLLTFSDMIYFALCVLVTQASERIFWQDRFDFVLVDEFQDLNNAQMCFLRVLAAPRNNLFVVGDDDQLIYAWRGAHAGHILEFEDSFPGARTVILQTNYRSSRKIVRHANWLIRHNRRRVEKDIRARPGAPAGIFEIAIGQNLADIAETAVGWVKKRHAEMSLSWNDFGILYRTNDEARWLEPVLRRDRIPFSVSNNSEDAIEGKEEDETEDRLSLITIHKAKGKEYPYVVFFNLGRGSSGAGLDDERRVAYVGVTRAKEGLLITAQTRGANRFLRELAFNPDLADFDLPYLERLLVGFRRRLYLADSGKRAAAFLRRFNNHQQNEKGSRRQYRIDHLLEEIDRFESEIRFRRLLEGGRARVTIKALSKNERRK